MKQLSFARAGQLVTQIIAQLCERKKVRNTKMNSIPRNKIKTGQQVRIVLKKDQGTGKLTEGIVKDLLTKSTTHPHGIKVRLESGQVGRVKELVGQNNN
jgi:uncharacterized repeat protein (TIGR03833 family)